MTTTASRRAAVAGAWTRAGVGALATAALLVVAGGGRLPTPLLLSFGVLGGLSVSGAV